MTLPYFPDADLARVIKLAKTHTDSFVRFSHFLRRRVDEIAREENAETLDDLMAEIDHEVAGLNLEARKINRSRLLGHSNLASFTISLGALIGAGNPILHGVAGVVGSMSVMEIIKAYVARSKESLTLKQSDFYIPYLLKRGSKR